MVREIRYQDLLLFKTITNSLLAALKPWTSFLELKNLRTVSLFESQNLYKICIFQRYFKTRLWLLKDVFFIVNISLIVSGIDGFRIFLMKISSFRSKGSVIVSRIVNLKLNPYP